MNRRQFLATVGCTAVPFVSGCLDDPGTAGGLLEVFETDEPPSATIIDAADDRIRHVDPVQEGLRRAHTTGSVAEIEVSENEYDTVAEALSNLPYFDRTEHDPDYISGIYFRYEDTTFAVNLTPFCTDSWVKDAQSERGEYGWGGCYDREEWGTGNE